MEPGQIFGEMSILDGQARSADATAMGETLVLVLERADFLATLRQFPEAALRLCTMLSRTPAPVDRSGRRRHAASRQCQAGAPAADDSGPSSNRPSKPPQRQRSNPRIKGNPTQRDLGQLIGASRQKVNFHLGQWQAEGIIARDGNAFAIQNWKALQAIADSDADCNGLRSRSPRLETPEESDGGGGGR